MHHIAILNPKKAKFEDILSGKKTIESRWYKNKIAPFNVIKEGDIVYFKKTAGEVLGLARVSSIIQVEKPNHNELKNLIKKYGGEGLINLSGDTESIFKWAINKNVNYVILVFLKNVKKIKPFQIDKSGFGNAAAWLCVDDISRIKR